MNIQILKSSDLNASFPNLEYVCQEIQVKSRLDSVDGEELLLEAMVASINEAKFYRICPGKYLADNIVRSLFSTSTCQRLMIMVSCHEGFSYDRPDSRNLQHPEGL